MLNRYLFHVFLFFHVVLPPLLMVSFVFVVSVGKFGERLNKPTTTVTVKDPSHLFSLLSDAVLDISTLR